MNRYAQFFVLLVVLVNGSECSGQESGEKATTPAQRTQVMVFGTFHFSQVEPADEMLTEKRQNEISELLDVLEKFKPDKIFVERNPEFEYVNKIGERYEKHLRGELKLNANEIYQIGFRLGKRLGHKEIFQADHPGRYGMYNSKVREYAKKNGQTDILDGKAPATTLGLYRTKNMGELLEKSTVIEHLRFCNSKEYERADHGSYLSTLPRIGDTKPRVSEDEEKNYEDEYFVGAAMLTDWYRRNIMIYSKVLTQLDFKEERILVIFGAGHNSTLKHLFQSNPHFELVDTHAWLTPEKNNAPQKEVDSKDRK